jgi:hypothetical protein
MPYLRPYRVAETTTTTGTGSITLAGAVTGYASFSSELANADTATIVIEAIDAAGAPTGDYEICDTAFTSPSTLTRGTLRDSSTGSRINFAAGSKRVFAINPRDAVDLGSVDVVGTLGVAKGGTGATDAATARTNLGAGTVTSVGGTGTVNGLTLTGTVTGSGSLTLGGTLSGVSLTTQVTGTLPVANGGTGATTLTANNVILGNGTSAVQFVAPGASGNVLTSNGTTWTSAAAGASLLGDTDSASPFETSLGFEAGAFNTGDQNTFIGYQSGRANTSGEQNSALGYQSFIASTTGNRNVAFGASALYSNTTGIDNVAVGGNLTLYSNTTGSSNVAVGKSALQSNINGIRNVAVGFNSLDANTSGERNLAIGAAALGASTTASNNTAIGDQAGGQILTGFQNTIIGSAAGSSGTNDLTTGSNNIMIGYNAAASSATVNNETTIGNSSTTSARIFGDVKFLKSYTETVFAVTDGATVNLDPNNGSIQTWTLGANRTPGQANWEAGQSITLMIDDGSAFTVTWTTLGVVWETNGGTAPTLATTGFTVIVLWKVGTTIYGARVGDA